MAKYIVVSMIPVPKASKLPDGLYTLKTDVRNPDGGPVQVKKNWPTSHTLKAGTPFRVARKEDGTFCLTREGTEVTLAFAPDAPNAGVLGSLLLPHLEEFVAPEPAPEIPTLKSVLAQAGATKAEALLALIDFGGIKLSKIAEVLEARREAQAEEAAKQITAEVLAGELMTAPSAPAPAVESAPAV